MKFINKCLFVFGFVSAAFFTSSGSFLVAFFVFILQLTLLGMFIAIHSFCIAFNMQTESSENIKNYEKMIEKYTNK
ncbi:hypothetical protein NUSPORA_02538 [Nucleospora cyclopteri]